MATEKTKALAAIKQVPTFLGRYRTKEEIIAGKPVMVARRDEWTPFEQFKDRTERRTYEVQLNGSLKRI